MKQERVHHTLIRSKSSKEFSLPVIATYEQLVDFLSKNEDLEKATSVSYLKRFETRPDVIAAVQDRITEELRVKSINVSECKLLKWSDFVD